MELKKTEAGFEVWEKMRNVDAKTLGGEKALLAKIKALSPNEIANVIAYQVKANSRHITVAEIIDERVAEIDDILAEIAKQEKAQPK